MADVELIHHSLAAGPWSEMTLVEQLANVGSEVSRTEPQLFEIRRAD